MATDGGPSQPGASMQPMFSPFTVSLLAWIISFLVLATIAVGLRLYAARLSPCHVWKTTDLWLIIAALIVCYGSISATITGAAVVGVNHVKATLNPMSAMVYMMKIGFSDIITTTVTSGLCKVSILEFYKRIFITEGFIIICNLLIFFISAWMIGTVLTQIFCTYPISSAWNPQRQQLDANYDYPKAVMAIVGISIVLDFLVLCMPIRPIYKVQLALYKKVKIYAILCLGAFCVICSSVRFYYVHRQFTALSAATQSEMVATTVKACLWSKLEPSASIIAASLPTYGPFLKQKGVRAIFTSMRTFFSLHNKSRSSISSSSGSKDLVSKYYNGIDPNWHTPQPDSFNHENKIEAESTQIVDKEAGSYIRTTSEFMVTEETWQ